MINNNFKNNVRSILNISGKLKYKQSYIKSDYDAIKYDWLMVGKDLKKYLK